MAVVGVAAAVVVGVAVANTVADVAPSNAVGVVAFQVVAGRGVSAFAVAAFPIPTDIAAADIVAPDIAAVAEVAAAFPSVVAVALRPACSSAPVYDTHPLDPNWEYLFRELD